MTDLITALFDKLKSSNRVVYITANRKELVTRCPYCGDSIRNSKHGHLYVAVEAPHPVFCQRCSFAGLVTGNLLKDLDIYDFELDVAFEKNIKKFLKNTNKTVRDVNLSMTSHPKIPKYDFTEELFLRKVEYLSNRLGTDLERTELASFRFIGSIENYLVLNNNTRYLDDDNQLKLVRYLDKSGVSFVSQDGTHIVTRYFKANANGVRYKNTRIDNDQNFFANKACSIKSNLSILAPEVNLIVTEGIIDLFSAYLNFYRGKDNTNTAFYAMNGKSFNLIPILLMRHGFLNINYHIYSDRDVGIEKYKYLLDISKFQSVKISYNMKDKENDFGVTPDRIQIKNFNLK